MSKIAFFVSIVLALTQLSICDSSCGFGMYLDLDNTCQQCDLTCQTCNQANRCTSCYDGMFAIVRGATFLCDICPNVLKGCAICQTATICTTCSNAYYLLPGGSCASCNQLVPNCLLCTGNGTQCISCKAPFMYSNGRCVSNQTKNDFISTDSTSKQSSDTSNDSKNSGSTNNSISKQSQSKDQGGQITIAPTNSHTLCSVGQIQFAGQCFNIIPFCVNQSGIYCTNCDQPYVLSNGYCIPPNLIQSNPINLATQICGNRQYMTNDGCQNIGPQCLKFLTNGTCTQCDIGFYLYNGLCVEAIKPLINLSTSPSSNQILSNLQAQSLINTNTNTNTNSNTNTNTNTNSNTNTNNCNISCSICKAQDANYCMACNIGYTFVDGIDGKCFGF